jgi:hypothetical protein
MTYKSTVFYSGNLFEPQIPCCTLLALILFWEGAHLELNPGVPCTTEERGRG